MNKKIIFILTILIIFILLLSIIYIKNNTKINDNKIYISNDEIELQILKDTIQNEDKIQNENIEETSNRDSAANIIFEEKILNKESERRNVNITDDQKNNLKNIAFYNTISDENMQKIKEMNMTEAEFREYFYNSLVDMQKRVKLKEELLKEINDNSIKVNNQDFKKKVSDYNNYKNSQDNISINELLQKNQDLVNEYIEIIKNNYTKIEN